MKLFSLRCITSKSLLSRTVKRKGDAAMKSNEESTSNQRNNARLNTLLQLNSIPKECFATKKNWILLQEWPQFQETVHRRFIPRSNHPLYRLTSIESSISAIDCKRKGGGEEKEKKISVRSTTEFEPLKSNRFRCSLSKRASKRASKQSRENQESRVTYAPTLYTYVRVYVHTLWPYISFSALEGLAANADKRRE